MNFLSKIFSSEAKGIIDSGGKLIDNISTSDEEKSAAKNELSEIVMTGLNNLQKAQSEIIQLEARGNWLQRSWRPILMLAFGFIVIYAYFIEPAFMNVASEDLISKRLDPKFWDLLQIGLGGYVIGRSAEKVASTLTRNVDMPFIKKKDRSKIFG
ncbi:3TM-type holin [Sediminitomix flava]|uniref:Holin (3TMs family) n=1 Tax=Sediminitomix flava TaxID=379075 RepID=A0A315ZHK1_SEDFL|nr:3TM-type holin [Sediminitomix flava]PWJ44184.1 holin (3TMs family) [Sediminitomix flava]